MQKSNTVGVYVGPNKRALARKGPENIFGLKDDVSREDLNYRDAGDHFDSIWNALIKPAIEISPPISYDAAAVMLSGILSSRTKDGVEETYLKSKDCIHVQGRLKGVLLIAQIRFDHDVDQVWFPLSSTGNPKGVWIEFGSKAEKKEMQAMAADANRDLESWIVSSLRKHLAKKKSK